MPTQKNSLLILPKRTLQKRMRRFFANRVPRQDNLTLTVKNVYIFFSREGILFALLLMVTFVTGINYGNNLVLGLCFYLAGIWLVSVYITFSHVSGLTLRLLNVTMTEAGKCAWATVEISNKAKQPSRQLMLQFDHSDFLMEDDFEKSDFNQKISQQINHLYDKKTVRLPILTDKRGKLQLPRIIIKTVYPLGIMQAWAYAYFATPVWVYPKALPFDWQKSHALASDDESSYSQFQRKGQDDFDMLDEYQQGESLARVSWVHLARGHGMLSKHFADNVGREITLDYADMPASHHEQKLSQLAFAIAKIGKTEQPFMLNLPNEKGKLGQGKAFIDENLLRLAKTP